MRRVLFYPIIVGLLFAIVSCGQNVQTEQKSVWVKCDTVRPLISSEHLSFPAQVKAAEVVNMAFKVSGILERVFVEEGKTVRQGELIAQLDARDYALQLQAVEGEYLNIKADAERTITLYADSVITTADYDKARYGLQQITAKYENAKNQLSDTKLYAPFTGVVKRRLYDPPTVIGAGMPIVILLSSAMPEIEIHIPASIYQRRNEISSYSVKFDFLPKPIPLRVISIAPNANVDQLYAVRLALPSTMHEKPSVGMSAMVDIDFSKRTNSGVRIPTGAIFHEGDSDFVWVFSNNQANKRKIKVETLHTDGTTTITSGLKVDDIIISAGVHNVTEGQIVKPLPVTSKTNMGGIL